MATLTPRHPVYYSSEKVIDVDTHLCQLPPYTPRPGHRASRLMKLWEADAARKSGSEQEARVSPSLNNCFLLLFTFPP